MFPLTRALVADHRLPDRQLLKQQLESLGVEVDVEGNGSRAVDRLLNEPFDIVFLASDLPILKADVVYELLRGEGVHTPVVVSGAQSSVEQEYSQDLLYLPYRVSLSSLRSFLLRTLPRHAKSALLIAFHRELAAVEDAVEAEDLDKLNTLVGDLRELGHSIGSSGLMSTVKRLEACLHEQELQDHQLIEIRDMLAELDAISSKHPAGARTATQPTDSK